MKSLQLFIFSRMGSCLSQKSDVTIVGAGVVGIATAYVLAKKGMLVRVIDAGNGPATGASHQNGSQLSFSYADALASPGQLAATPRLLFGSNDAFRLSGKPTLQYACWLVAFLKNCTKAQFVRNTSQCLELAALSRDHLKALQDSYGLDFGFQKSGKMHLHYTEKGLAQARSLIPLKQQYCGEQSELTPAEAVALEPGLKEVESKLTGVIHSADDAVGDARQFCIAMQKILQEQFGVEFRYNEKVSSVDVEQEKAEIHLSSGDVIKTSLVIICCGSQSNKLLQPTGHSLPLLPMKGYSFEIPTGPDSPKVSVTDSKHRLVFTNLGHKMRIAGLAELGAANVKIDQSRIDYLIASAQKSLPNAGQYDRAGSFWAGLRPMTPNSLPVVSRPHQNLAINTGHGMLGWTLAMGAAARLAELV